MTQEEFKLIMKEPRFKKDALQISVRRIFTDPNGTIVDKTTVPAALQTSYPVYFFGEYDRQGAYWLGIKNTPPLPGYFYLTSFVYGINNPFFYGFTGLSDVQGQLSPGDLVTVFTDDLNAPNYFVYIVQSCPTRSLASILANLIGLPYDPDYGYVRVKHIDYYTPSINQWKENIKFITYDMLGLVSTNDISPFGYKPSVTINDQFIRLGIQFILNQYVGLNTYMLFETDTITLTCIIEHRLNELSVKNVLKK